MAAARADCRGIDTRRSAMTTAGKEFISLADEGKVYDALGTRTTLRARGVGVL